MNDRLRIGKSQTDQLERENARLADQLKEVVKMNGHWQRYDAQREEYVLKLTRTNQELQDEIDELRGRLDAKSGGKSEMPAKKTADRACETSGDAEEPQLQKDSEVVAALTDQVTKLRGRIAELEEKGNRGKRDEDDQIALLREQVHVCVEDFKQEREDREKVHGDNLKLMKRLALAEEQISTYETKITELRESKQYRPATVTRPPPRGGYDEPCCYPEDRPRGVPHHHGNNARYYGDDLTRLPSDVEIDGDDKKRDILLTNGVESSTEEDVEEVTSQCPRCMSSFERHSDLLKHVDTCID